jgi:hypothetical protein
MATGAGKTFCAASIIAELGVVPAIFFVTSKDLLKQAYDEFTKKIRLDGSPITVGRVGGGYTDIRDITVMTVQTAIKVCPKWDDALRKYTTAQFVKFDDEDEQDSTNIEPIRNDLLQTLYKCKLFMQDECLTGDSTVIIRGHGKKRLDELGDFVGKEILSFNGISVAWKKINKFIKSGIKCVLKITLNSGETIKCTSNHLIMTERGWVKAGELQKTDQVLFCAKQIP